MWLPQRSLCEETGHTPGACMRAVTRKFWTFRWEYFCGPCREYGFKGIPSTNVFSSNTSRRSSAPFKHRHAFSPMHRSLQIIAAALSTRLNRRAALVRSGSCQTETRRCWSCADAPSGPSETEPVRTPPFGVHIANFAIHLSRYGERRIRNRFDHRSVQANPPLATLRLQHETHGL
jgi:hypothetical protein